MKQSTLIKAPITDVFECISKAALREKWFPNVTSIRYPNPSDESRSSALFQLSAEEGKEQVTLQGRNLFVTPPRNFGFELETQSYCLRFSYQLQQQDDYTVVEQEFETKHYRPFMNIMDKLLKSSTKQTGDFVLTSLKDFCETLR